MSGRSNAAAGSGLAGSGPIPPASRHDVVIAGGGLAGLTLALQLKQRFADLDILVLERQRHPVPEAAHKVGESSVEIGADYFSRVLGLTQHLEEHQLKKFGFRFFSSEGRRDIGAVTEIGASRFLSVPGYQIDRGIFENFLAEEAARRGIAVVCGATVRDIALSEAGDPHRLTYRVAGEQRAAEAGWLIDACGRAGLIKKKLALAEPNAHDANAVWFRMKDRIVIDEWSADPAWRGRCDPAARWLSTNHLVGAGYWVWLIPLSSGAHSVGIVADAKLHPLATMNSFDKAMEWLRRYQPRVFDELDGKRDRLLDFAFFRRFSYGCKQVFSGQRWALTGEAGLFLDPFYSPGSDFIAIANTYICELIGRDRAGRPLDAHAAVYDQIFHSFYESTLALYTDQYPIFGDPEVLPVKVIWDYTYYWGVLAQFFFQRRIADLSALSALREELAHCQALNRELQALLRAWSAARPLERVANPAVMLDQASLPWFAALNKSLLDTLDDAGFRERIRHSTRQMRSLAAEIAARAGPDGHGPARDALDRLLAEDGFGRLAPGPPMLFTPPAGGSAAAAAPAPVSAPMSATPAASAASATPRSAPRRDPAPAQAVTRKPAAPAHTEPMTAAPVKP
ncbi:MAG: NAD(P)/FAD-dependent oxidoreductase [Caldimonas sp.]